MHMLACCAHGQDDPDPARAGRAASPAARARRARREDALGLSPPRARGSSESAHARRAARAARDGGTRRPARASSGRRARRARRARHAVIVLDASAMLEMLLRTPSAAAIEARVFRRGETTHVPSLLDLEVA